MRLADRNNPERTQADDRRRLAAKLYLRGMTQEAIGEELGVDQATVSRALATVRAEWRAAAVRDYGDWLGEELARVDNLMKTAWAAWERSCQDQVTRTVERRPSGDVVIVRRRSSAGNPAFLAQISDCLDARCRLLGLYQPTKVARTDPDGEAVGKLTEDDRVALIGNILHQFPQLLGYIPETP